MTEAERKKTSFKLDPQNHAPRISSEPGRATAGAPRQPGPARCWAAGGRLTEERSRRESPFHLGRGSTTHRGLTLTPQ